MGADPSAMVVIGVDVPITRDMFGKTRVRSCEHRMNVNDVNFCPTCGKPVVEAVQNNQFQEFEGIYAFVDLLEKKLRPYPNFIVMDMSGEDDGEVVYMGLGMSIREGWSSTEDIEGDDFLPMDEIKQILKDILEPFGLYDENSFGLHAALRWS